MKSRIVVPVDGSERALEALEVATDLARQRGQGLRLMHVVPHGGVPRGLEKWAAAEHVHESGVWLYDQGIAERVLSDAEDRVAASGGLETERLIEHGDPASAIIAASRGKDVAMIVMGSRGLGDLGGLVLGSVAHKVAHGAHCKVVSVS